MAESRSSSTVNGRLLIATSNPGKIREVRRLLNGCPAILVTPADVGLSLYVEETGTTYAENAILKALAFARATGLPSLADDSGLEVDALEGRPGIHSARYGGPGLDDGGRVALLLRELEGVPDGRRTARYVAVVALANPTPAVPHVDDSVLTFEGLQYGSIAAEPRGSNGFGYDPVFLVDGRRTQAEIPDEIKARISHRGTAIRKLCAHFGRPAP